VNKFWDAGTERYLRPVDSPAHRRVSHARRRNPRNVVHFAGERICASCHHLPLSSHNVLPPSLFLPLNPSSSLHFPCSNHFICYRLKLVESYRQCVVHKRVDATYGHPVAASTTPRQQSIGGPVARACLISAGVRVCRPSGGNCVLLTQKYLQAREAGPWRVPYDLHGPSAPLLLRVPSARPQSPHHTSPRFRTTSACG
jgi:hypothetical protein